MSPSAGSSASRRAWLGRGPGSGSGQGQGQARARPGQVKVRLVQYRVHDERASRGGARARWASRRVTLGDR